MGARQSGRKIELKPSIKITAFPTTVLLSLADDSNHIPTYRRMKPVFPTNDDLGSPVESSYYGYGPPQCCL